MTYICEYCELEMGNASPDTEVICDECGMPCLLLEADDSHRIIAEKIINAVRRGDTIDQIALQIKAISESASIRSIRDLLSRPGYVLIDTTGTEDKGQ